MSARKAKAMTLENISGTRGFKSHLGNQKRLSDVQTIVDACWESAGKEIPAGKLGYNFVITLVAPPSRRLAGKMPALHSARAVSGRHP